MIDWHASIDVIDVISSRQCDIIKNIQFRTSVSASALRNFTALQIVVVGHLCRSIIMQHQRIQLSMAWCTSTCFCFSFAIPLPRVGFPPNAETLQTETGARVRQQLATAAENYVYIQTFY